MLVHAFPIQPVYIFATGPQQTQPAPEQRHRRQRGAARGATQSNSPVAKQHARRELLRCFDLTTCEIVRMSEDEINNIATAKARQARAHVSEHSGAIDGDTPVPALSLPGGEESASARLGHAGAVASQSRILLLRPLTTPSIDSKEPLAFESGICAFRAESAAEAQEWADALVSALGAPLAHIDALGLCFSRTEPRQRRQLTWVRGAAATISSSRSRPQKPGNKVASRCASQHHHRKHRRSHPLNNKVNSSQPTPPLSRAHGSRKRLNAHAQWNQRNQLPPMEA